MEVSEEWNDRPRQHGISPGSLGPGFVRTGTAVAALDREGGLFLFSEADAVSNRSRKKFGVLTMPEREGGRSGTVAYWLVEFELRAC